MQKKCLFMEMKEKNYLKKLIKLYQRGSMAQMPPPQTMIEEE